MTVRSDSSNQVPLATPEGRVAARVLVEADGGSRGNPGPAGYGVVVRDAATGEVLAERGESIGRCTNNVAEYRGLIAGLRAAAELAAGAVEVRMDSKLVVEQMSGNWKVKHPDLKPLASEAAAIVRMLPSVTFRWVPRSRNAHADRLANDAMDGSPTYYARSGRESEVAAVSAGATSTVDAGSSTRLVLTCALPGSGRIDADWLDDDTDEALLRRIRRARDRTMTDRGGSEVAVVAPARSIAALVCLALGAPATAIPRIALGPGGVCIVDWNADGTATLRAIHPPPGP